MNSHVRELLSRSSLQLMVMSVDMQPDDDYPETIEELVDRAWGECFQTLNFAYLNVEDRGESADSANWGGNYLEAISFSVDALLNFIRVLHVRREPYGGAFQEDMIPWRGVVMEDIEWKMLEHFRFSELIHEEIRILGYIDSVFRGEGVAPPFTFAGLLYPWEKMQLIHGDLTMHEHKLLREGFQKDVKSEDRDLWPLDTDIWEVRRVMFHKVVVDARSLEGDDPVWYLLDGR